MPDLPAPPSRPDTANGAAEGPCIDVIDLTEDDLSVIIQCAEDFVVEWQVGADSEDA